MARKYYIVFSVILALFVFIFPRETTSQTYTLTVNETGTGSGAVKSSPAGINCPEDCVEPYDLGKRITLKAKASPDSYFVGWSGEDCSGTKACAVTLNSDTTITAWFDKKVPILAFSPQILTFEDIEVGQKDTQILTVTNEGTGNLEVTFSGLEGSEFRVIGSSTIALKPKKKKSVKVQYLKSEAGTHEATLKYESNDPNNSEGVVPIVPVLGAGYNLEIRIDVDFSFTQEEKVLHQKVTVDKLACQVALGLFKENGVWKLLPTYQECQALVETNATGKCTSCWALGSVPFGIRIEDTSTYIPGPTTGTFSLDITMTWVNPLYEGNCYDTCKVGPQIPIPTPFACLMPPLQAYPVDIEATILTAVESPFTYPPFDGKGTLTWIIRPM